MADDVVLAQLGQLETAVRKAGEALVRLRDENAQLRREATKLGDDRRQVLAQIDMLLKDIGKLDLE